MMRALLVVVLVAAAIAAAWSVFSGGDEAGSPTSVETTRADATKGTDDSARPARVDSPEALAPSDGATRSLAATAADETGGAPDGTTAAKRGDVRVEGRVVDEFGRAVADAEVVFNRSEFEPFSIGEAREPTRTETDAQGRFAFDGVAPADGAFVRVRPQQHVDARVAVPRSESKVVDLGDIVTELGGSVAGHVLDETGNPIGGATVTAFGGSRPSGSGKPAGIFVMGGFDDRDARGATADHAGFFRIDGLAPGEVVALAAADGFTRESKRDIVVEKNKVTTKVSIALSRGFAIEGVVVDERGKGLPGARVSFMETVIDLSEGGLTSMLDRSRGVAVDSHGGFRIDGLKEGTYNLVAQTDGYLAERATQVAAGSTGVRIVQRPSGLLYGVVRDKKTKAPVDTSDVRVRRVEDGAFVFTEPDKRSKVLTGADAAALLGMTPQPGLFALQNLPGTTLELLVDADGYTTFGHGPIEVAPGEKVAIDVDLVPEIRVSGIVLDPQGNPVAKARVVMAEDHSEDELSGPGTFRVGRRVEVETDDSGGHHVITNDGQKSAITGADGRFSIRGLAAGDHTIDVSHDDWAPSETEDITLEDGDTFDDVELALRAGGGLKGVAFDDQGTPLPGARVTASPFKKDRGGRSMRIGGGGPFGGFDDGSRSAAADDEGRYELRGLLPGEYRARIARPDVGSRQGMMAFSFDGMDAGPQGAAVVIEPGLTAELDLHLPPTGKVAGVVTEAGRALPNVSVSLKQKDSFLPFGIANGMTDAAGEFALADISPGDYVLEVAPSGAADAVRRDVEVRARETVRENVSLPSGVIAGRVIDPSGRGIAGVTVDVRSAGEEGAGDDEPRQTRGFAVIAMRMDEGGGGATTMKFGNEAEQLTTNDEGYYEVRYLAAGEYEVRVRGAGIIPQEKERVRVEESARTDKINFQAELGAKLTVKIVTQDPDEEMMFFRAELKSLERPDDTEERMEAGATSTLFDGLEPGSYVISVSANELAGEQTVSLESGEEREITITLE